MIIATKRCFVVADRVDYISIEESMEEDGALAKEIHKERRLRAKMKSGKRPPKRMPNSPFLTKYTIKIHYTPTVAGSGLRDNLRECLISTYSESVAMTLYGEIIKQYREQNPDQLYLDKIAEDFLGGLNCD